MYCIIEINNPFITKIENQKDIDASRSTVDTTLEEFFNTITEKTSFYINSGPVNYIDTKNHYPFFNYSGKQEIQACFYLSIHPKQLLIKNTNHINQQLAKMIQLSVESLLKQNNQDNQDNESRGNNLADDLVSKVNHLESELCNTTLAIKSILAA